MKTSVQNNEPRVDAGNIRITKSDALLCCSPFKCSIVLLFFFLFTHSSNHSFAQSSKIDSLLTLLKKDKEDTNKVNHLNNISREYIDIGSYDSAVHYASQALAYCEKLLLRPVQLTRSSFLKEKANAYSSIGIVYYRQGDYPNALDYYFKALKLREELRDKRGIATILGNIGIIYHYQDNNSKALDYLMKALKSAEELNDKFEITKHLGNIGGIYWNQGDYSKALDYYFKALKAEEEAGDKIGISIWLGNIGNVYMNQAQDTPDPAYMAELSNLALEYLFKALKINEELGRKNGITIILGNIGTLYTKQKKHKEAEEYLLKSLSIANEIGSLEDISEANINLSELYSAKGDYKKAYEHHQQYSIAKDSLFSEEGGRQIAEMQTKYETEKKEQQITLLNKDKELQDAQLNRQKIIIWSVAGGLLVVLILSVFIFQERKKSEKLLLNILPAETARELKAKGKASPKYYEQVTVMFTDFKGFTTIAEKLSAEELVSQLDFLFKKFDEIISKYPIEKIKTIGDAYMCAGGLPTANITHAMDVVSVAIEIQSWMTELKTNDSRLNTWELRIGIHTGAVTAGVVGDKKFAYDIWGDTVNTASRMESSGEAGKINISGATHELIKDKFTSSFRGKIPAKNKGEIEMYFVGKC